MKDRPVWKALTALIFGNLLLSAQAASVGLDAMSYDGSSGQVTVTVIYDFTDTPIFGGGLNLIYDASALEFVAYEQAPLPADAFPQYSPIGVLESPGFYRGFGIGAGKFGLFNGMTSAGSIGTFTFDVLGTTDTNATICGMTLCLIENQVYPWTSLSGALIGDDMLSNGIAGANVVAPVPIPAAIYLLMGSLFGLLRFGRYSTQPNDS